MAPGALNNVAFELLQAAEMEGWEAELIEAAYQERPRNPKVRTVYEHYRLDSRPKNLRGWTRRAAPCGHA